MCVCVCVGGDGRRGSVGSLHDEAAAADGEHHSLTLTHTYRPWFFSVSSSSASVSPSSLNNSIKPPQKTVVGGKGRKGAIPTLPGILVRAHGRCLRAVNQTSGFVGGVFLGGGCRRWTATRGSSTTARGRQPAWTRFLHTPISSNWAGLCLQPITRFVHSNFKFRSWPGVFFFSFPSIHFLCWCKY